jgi:hypothetical protein
MQGDDPTTARARQLLDSCSRTIAVTRIQTGDGVKAFRAETSAFPELHAGGAAAAAVALPGASDEFPTPFFNDGIKTPENFNVDGGEGRRKICLLCLSDLIGDEHGEALAVGQSVTLRQLMCTHPQPGTGALQPAACKMAGGSHYFPHVYHGPCIENWFRTKLQEGQPPSCLYCRAVFSNDMAQPHPPAPAPEPPVPQGPLVRSARCLRRVDLCPRAYACPPGICRTRALAPSPSALTLSGAARARSRSRRSSTIAWRQIQTRPNCIWCERVAVAATLRCL